MKWIRNKGPNEDVPAHLMHGVDIEIATDVLVHRLIVANIATVIAGGLAPDLPVAVRVIGEKGELQTNPCLNLPPRNLQIGLLKCFQWSRVSLDETDGASLPFVS